MSLRRKFLLFFCIALLLLGILSAVSAMFLLPVASPAYIFLFPLGFGLILTASILVLLEKSIISRLSSLNDQLSTLEKNRPSTMRVTVSGQDELSHVAKSINQMLTSLETAQNELKQSDSASRTLLDGVPDFLLRIDKKGTILDFKTNRDRLVATPAKLLPGNSIFDAYPVEMANKMAAALEQALESQSVQLFEYDMVLNSQVLHMEIRVTPIGKSEALAIIRNFSERQQLEKSMQFFNLRDLLTGLFNRTYWEQKLLAVSRLDDTAVGIILCDIDEMRLINDSLGVEHGNHLLNATAAALRASLPLDAVVARIGAENFAALLIGVSEEELEKIARKIREEVEHNGEKEVLLRFAVTLGYASGIPAETGIQEILKAAQARLHRKKLSHSQTSRNNLFQSLQTALETRDFVTHQHAARLWALGRSLAKEAGMSNRKLRDFKLLAQFHDIGKVGVPDEVIFKQGRLTPDEMKQMTLHVEIGHRIAQSIPELNSIADLLLKHHEWWNGKGYPLGLNEEEIPLECRIFSIVDAFDAMTNDRPDRKALTAKEAAAELRRCAGSQFDPVLVKKFLTMLGEEL